MKAILFVVLMNIFSLLSTTDVLSATGSATVISPWEREAEAALWEGSFFSDGGLYENRYPMPLHAGCGAALFRKTAVLRTTLSCILERDLGIRRNDAASALCARLLLKTGAVDARGLDERERLLIDRSRQGAGFVVCDNHSLGGTEPPNERIGPFLSANGIAPAGLSFKTAPKRRDVPPNQCEKAQLHSGYCTDCLKADYFRLFLYLWEDIPWLKTGDHIPPVVRTPVRPPQNQFTAHHTPFTTIKEAFHERVTASSCKTSLYHLPVRGHPFYTDS